MKLQNIIGTTKSRLTKFVAKEILELSEEYDSVEQCLNDVVKHGCASGVVPSLIYYDDTEKFFDDFEEEILELTRKFFNSLKKEVLDLLDEYELENRESFKTEECFNRKNQLAWFAYEHVAAELLNQIEGE